MTEQTIPYGSIEAELLAADPDPAPPPAPSFAEAASRDEIEMDAAMDFSMVVGARLGFEAVKAIAEGRIRNVRIDYGSR